MNYWFRVGWELGWVLTSQTCQGFIPPHSSYFQLHHPLCWLMITCDKHISHTCLTEGHGLLFQKPHQTIDIHTLCNRFYFFSNVVLLMSCCFFFNWNCLLLVHHIFPFKYDTKFIDLSPLVIQGRYYNTTYYNTTYICMYVVDINDDLSSTSWAHLQHYLPHTKCNGTHWRPRPASLRSCLTCFYLICAVPPSATSITYSWEKQTHEYCAKCLLKC